MKTIYVKTLPNVTNYSVEKFKTSYLQRDICPVHIKNLLKDFEENDCCYNALTLLETSAFDGVPTLYLVDGNNRRYSAIQYTEKKGFPLPLTFIVFRLDVDTVENIAKYMETTNNLRKDWANPDYLKNSSIIGVNPKEVLFYLEQQKVLNLPDSYLKTILTEPCSWRDFRKGNLRRLRDTDKLIARIRLYTVIQRQTTSDSFGLPKGNGLRKFVALTLGLNAQQIYALIDVLNEHLHKKPFSNDEREIEEYTNQLIDYVYDMQGN